MPLQLEVVFKDSAGNRPLTSFLKWSMVWHEVILKMLHDSVKALATKDIDISLQVQLLWLIATQSHGAKMTYVKIQIFITLHRYRQCYNYTRNWASPWRHSGHSVEIFPGETHSWYALRNQGIWTLTSLSWQHAWTDRTVSFRISKRLDLI